MSEESRSMERAERKRPPESIRELDPDHWDPREILGDVDLPRPIPIRALVLSFASLFVPVLAAVWFPELAAVDVGLLLWLTAFIPAFLLTYYRGWHGVSLALALGMATLALSQVAFLLGGVSVSSWPLLGGLVVIYVTVTLGIGYLAELLQRERRTAERMALTDSLTGMPNRRHAVVFIEAAFAAARRGVPLTVVLFGLDRFKVFNDTHGHPAGDQALRAVGEILIRSTRRMNLTARWGGDEFLSILSETQAEGGRVFANRVLSEIRQAFPSGAITASAGVAPFSRQMDSPAWLLGRADDALYLAKAAGGNTVRVAGELPEGEIPHF